MNVLSLFDGISCGQLALQRAGLEVENYWASEIDKYAIKITQKNFPNTIQIGDVNNIDFSQYVGKIDLLIGGSPCQDLSIAKKDRAGLEGKRSGLFWKYVEALEAIKPKYFLLENVASMPKEAKETITDILDVEPILINSALVSAQQRKRLYWTNIPNVAQPEDKGIFLKDILESGEVDSDKSYCIDANYSKSGNLNSYLDKKRRQLAFEPAIYQLPRGNNKGGIKKDKAPTMTTGQWEYNNLLCEPVRIGTLEGLGSGQANRIYSVQGKSVCLNANGGGGAKTGLYKIDLPDGDYVVRKLTPIECERLQTLPDNYTEGVSNTQRYKCLGNGWTVDVIAHIFKGLKNEY